MKTILLISPYWREKHRWMVSSYKLAELWQRMGYRVVVVCMGNKVNSEKRKVKNEKVSDTLTIYWVKDLFLPDPFNYGIAPTFLFHVLKACKVEKPDIVIINKIMFWSSYVAPVLRLLGRKPIVITDALIGMTWWPRSLFTKIISFFMAWTCGWLVLLSAKKVAFFHPQPSWLLRLLCIKGKSRVVPTGIDETAYQFRGLVVDDGEIKREKRKAPYAPEELPPSLELRGTGRSAGEKNGGVVITYVGRLESVKGVDDFLAAVEPLVSDRVQAQVVGWFKKDHSLVDQYKDRITFTGLRDDIPQIMAKTDIFVLPSYSEGLSNALMEAMASSCACIATRVGGNRFLIEEGVSGFLYKPGDRENLTALLTELIQSPQSRESMCDAARRRIEKMFSWSVVEKKYAKLFGDEYEIVS